MLKALNAKNCYKLPFVEQRITKLDWKSTMYSDDMISQVNIYVWRSEFMVL